MAELEPTKMLRMRVCLAVETSAGLINDLCFASVTLFQFLRMPRQKIRIAPISAPSKVHAPVMIKAYRSL